MYDADTNKTYQASAYQEKKIGKTLYCVTSIYTGKLELNKALEELIIKKILRDPKSAYQSNTTKL